MKYVYSISSGDELAKYQKFVRENEERIRQYVNEISKDYHIAALPKYMVLANLEMATKVHCDIVIPAYTNEARMVITPELSVWKTIYLKQINRYRNDNRTDMVKRYYDQIMSENVILQIIGHEIAHHSELFLNDFDDEDSEILWFEEGMVEYISRKFFLTEAEFAEERDINRLLVELFEENHSAESIENFGQSTYDGSYASIFYAYWKSFLCVEHLVETFGSAHHVFQSYHDWHADGRNIPLSQWFQIE